MVARGATVVACGFLAVSAIANFMFAFSLAGSPLLAVVYGSVGILATASNAVIPLRMLEAWNARRYAVMVAGAALLPFCVLFSLTSAMGFAAAVRDASSADHAALAQNYQTTLAMLKDAEGKLRAQRNEQRIEALRLEVKSYRERGALRQVDPQSTALQMLGIVDGRYHLSLLFALLIEFGSVLGLFIALADMKRKEPTQWRPRVARI